MFNTEILSFLSLLGDCADACGRLEKYGYGGKALEEAAADYVQKAIKHNVELVRSSSCKNDDATFLIGRYELQKYGSSENLEKFVGNLYGRKSFEIGFSLKKHVALDIVTIEEEREQAEILLQSALAAVTSAYKKGDCVWKCIAGKDSGAFLGPLIKAVTGDSVYGGRVYSDEHEASKLLTEIENTIAANIATSEGANIFDFNAESENTIPVTNLIIGDLSNFSDSFRKKASSLFAKAPRGGVNLFLIDSLENGGGTDTDGVQVLFCEDGRFFFCNSTMLPAEIVINPLEKTSVEELLKVRQISSLIQDNFDLNTPPYSMNADECLSIPFAIERDKICNFRIGGIAPPHALISGITGSGKSVTLHTIIDMISYNYHPDEAEIWAIDYKAVEFGCYVNERTPNIRVIGQDNSAEFSTSLIDMIYDEYRSRIKAFDAAGVKKLSEYKAKFGRRSMPRILIVIDEFHNLVQAVQNSFDSTYKTKLENLLKEMRAVGMSFLFCSQSISSGLSGLTEAGRNQIGIRLCMNHMSNADITETLAIKGSETEIIDSVKRFSTGHAMYRASATAECKEVKVLYISDEIRSDMIKKANAALGDDYKHKEEIICKNSDRYEIAEKPMHRLNKFVKGMPVGGDEEEVLIFPAAPTTLYPEFCLPLARNSSNNLLLVGNDDSMRESVLFMSVCSILANPKSKVCVNIVNSEDSDGIRLYELMSKIRSSRLKINFGALETMASIESYSKIKPLKDRNVFNVWYGLNKLKTAVTLALESMEDEQNEPEETSPELELEALMNSLINHTATEGPKKVTSFDSFEDYSAVLRKLFEFGPECGLFNIVAYNNPKSFSKDSFLKLIDFDYRIGLQMSVDDSYTVFGSEQFTKKANETTAVCYTGSQNPVSVRPYLIPSEEWINKFKDISERERI